MGPMNGFAETMWSTCAGNASIAAYVLVGIISAVVLIPAVLHLRKDFLAFKALGPGGTPLTWKGYMRVKVLGLFALGDPYRHLPSTTTPGYLHDLTRRSCPRPITAGIAPHRQLTQRANLQTFNKIAQITRVVASSNDHLRLGTSCFEKHGTGLFSTSPVRITCNGEIFHAHPSDGSMHLTLHPADVNVVLGSRWGERHPLARGGWFEKFVPQGFVMIYSPQSEDEIATVFEIIKAAAWYVSAGQVPNIPDLPDHDEQGGDSGYASEEPVTPCGALKIFSTQGL